MEKLELILQEIVVERFGQRTWQLLLQKYHTHQGFDQHLESYGAQRVAAAARKAPAAERDPASPQSLRSQTVEAASCCLGLSGKRQDAASPDQPRSPGDRNDWGASPGAHLLDSAAALMEMTVPGLLEELGGYYARSLQKCDFPHRPPASDADCFPALAFYFNSCSWIMEALVPGSLQVKTIVAGRLKIQCALRENPLGVFLKGFLSEVQGGPTAVTRAETTTPRREITGGPLQH